MGTEKIALNAAGKAAYKTEVYLTTTYRLRDLM